MSDDDAVSARVFDAIRAASERAFLMAALSAIAKSDAPEPIREFARTALRVAMESENAAGATIQ